MGSSTSWTTVVSSSATVEPTTTSSVATRTTKAPVFDEVCETTGVTLKRFMTEVTMLNPELQELTTLFGAIDTACKAIANLVKRSQLPSSTTLGYEGAVNVQGEDQKVCEFSPMRSLHPGTLLATFFHFFITLGPSCMSTSQSFPNSLHHSY
jgi:hypothetical protein